MESSYERKWVSLREYIPFIRELIEKLESRQGSTAELSKVKSLYRVLSTPIGQERRSSIRMETLLKCEEILKVLYEQVEGPQLESPKSPPPLSRMPLHGSQTHYHHRPPRIIPLERRSGGIEFTHHHINKPPPLTYGEHRKIRDEQHPPPTPKTLEDRPPPPSSPDLESPESPKAISNSPEAPLSSGGGMEDEDLSDSESESLQIDEQLPFKKEEEEDMDQDPSSILQNDIKEKETQENIHDFIHKDVKNEKTQDDPLKDKKKKKEEKPIIKTEIDEDVKTSPHKKRPHNKQSLPLKKELRPELHPVFFASSTEDQDHDPVLSLQKAQFFTPSSLGDLRSSRSVLKSLHDKVTSQVSTLKRSSGVRMRVTEVKERRSSPLHDDSLVLTERPESYSRKMSDIISRLQISGVAQEDEEINDGEDISSSSSSSLDLLPLIKDLKKGPIQGEGEEDVKMEDLCVSDKSLKKGKVISDELGYLLPLFKCWNCTYYATDSLEDYKSHLSEEEGLSTFLCVYCQKDFEVLEDFLDHVILTHGRCPYQCPFCEYRSSSRLSLLIHEQHLHPEKNNKSYYSVKYLSDESSSKFEVLSPLNCRFCDSAPDLYSHEEVFSHVQEKHPNKVHNSTQYFCPDCPASFLKVIELFVHHAFQHGDAPLNIGILSLNSQQEEMKKLPPLSCSSGALLCGFEDCKAPFKSMDTLETHMKDCSHIKDSYISCCLCEDEDFDDLEAILRHLKTHSELKYHCALCSYCDLTYELLVKHLKSTHNVDKATQINRPDESNLCMVLPDKPYKRLQGMKSKKNTYSPNQISEVPRVSMFKSPIHCSECDFVTKVRMNFIKHARLHRKSYSTGVITPINPPPSTDGRHFQNMGVINEEGEGLLTSEEIGSLPVLIPENSRFACCAPGCNYITLDEVMLLYHIKTLHPPYKDAYDCPHCADSNGGARIDYDDLGFHLKCHGELLFKCTYCTFFHWQKRTVQQHVVETHKDIRGLIRDVRKDAEARRALSLLPAPAPVQKEKVQSEEKLYRPFHCGFCSNRAFESRGEVKDHLKTTHGLLEGHHEQFFCYLCRFAADEREEMFKHFAVNHGQGGEAKDNCLLLLQAYYVEQSKKDVDKQQQTNAPLWSRGMARIRHIRGILFDDEKPKKTPAATPLLVDLSNEPEDVLNTSGSSNISNSSGTANPSYKPKCSKCGAIKKTIKNLKIHIQSAHLQSNTQVACTHCAYTAVTVKSVKIHHKRCHPAQTFVLKQITSEEGGEGSSPIKLDHQYWKSVWGIPRPQERRRLGYDSAAASSSFTPNMKKKKKATTTTTKGSFKCQNCDTTCSSLKGLKLHNTKSHSKTEVIDLVDDEDESIPPSSSSSTPINTPIITQSNSSSNTFSSSTQETIIKYLPKGESPSKKTPKDIISAVLEISPFEHVPTFKCLYCPKRTQSLIRIERHLSSEHPNQASGHRMLTRDQVVELVGGSVASTASSEAEYACYLCDGFTGDISSLQNAHFPEAHPGQSLKVKKRVPKGCTQGYLECQVCGHLTGGFDRSQQKVHYHEEHPLEENIVAHKYILKRKPFEAPDKKFDFNKYTGRSIGCPREDCDFECKSVGAIMGHLRKHTQTFKCGHCGNIFRSSSTFNNHSAMIHGDKIPDLVKDMEAEAELEALKALLEDSLCKSS